MPLKNYQERIDAWAKQFKVPYWAPHQMYAQLGEECGEVAREINHLHGPKKKKDSEKAGDLGEELADVILTCIFIANLHGINLDEKVMAAIEKKYYIRDKDRFEKKE